MTKAPVVVLAIALPLAALAGATAAPAGSAGSEHAQANRSAAGSVGRLTVIHGSVGPGYDISVAPRRVPAGRYRFVIVDLSGAHNWHIYGPGGVDEATTVEGSGRTVWRLKLIAGAYTIQCDPHAPVMHTRLRVT